MYHASTKHPGVGITKNGKLEKNIRIKNDIQITNNATRRTKSKPEEEEEEERDRNQRIAYTASDVNAEGNMYTGETGRPLEIRITEYKRNTKNRRNMQFQNSRTVLE